MIIWGGEYNNTATQLGYVYDPNSDSWTSLSSLGAPLGRSEHAAVWAGDKMLIVGGSIQDASGDDMYQNKIILQDGGSYNPSSSIYFYKKLD